MINQNFECCCFGREYVRSEGLVQRMTKTFGDSCQAGLNPCGLQRDATDRPSRKRMHIKMYMRIDWVLITMPKCGNVHFCARRSFAQLLVRPPEAEKRKKVNLQRLKRVHQMNEL